MNPAWENRNSAGAQGQDAANNADAAKNAGGAKELHQLPESPEPRLPDLDLPDLDNTLRLIATLPVPEGLEERVHAALRTAPSGARVLAWPALLRPQTAWLGAGWARTAAAAAIVFVVAGGGWGVYLHLPHATTKAIAIPASRKTGGFSSAGAIHTPESIQGPVITNPAVSNPATSSPAVANPVTASPVTADQLVAKPSAHSKKHPGKLKGSNTGATGAVTADPVSDPVLTPAAPAQR